uniref:Uncharacterized protein n=1 Tax=Sarcophilus harrisii TaxID=9305 RepID=A0A7N4V884_SARHA
MDRMPSCSCLFELRFLPKCNSILLFSRTLDTVTCPRYSFSTGVPECKGEVVKNLINLPVIDRHCFNFGHEGLAYHTRQMHSTDKRANCLLYLYCQFQKKKRDSEYIPENY